MRARTTIVTGVMGGVLVLAGGAPASAGGGCMHGTGPTDGAGTVVELVDACFAPTVLHVEPGTEVTFANRDATVHQVTGVGGTWGTFDDVQLGERVTYTFAGDGVYVYSCFLHPGMVGAIVAGSGDGGGAADPASVEGPMTTTPADGVARDAVADGGELGAALVGATIGLVLGGGLALAAVRRRRIAADEPAIV